MAITVLKKEGGVQQGMVMITDSTVIFLMGSLSTLFSAQKLSSLFFRSIILLHSPPSSCTHSQIQECAAPPTAGYQNLGRTAPPLNLVPAGGTFPPWPRPLLPIGTPGMSADSLPPPAPNLPPPAPSLSPRPGSRWEVVDWRDDEDSPPSSPSSSLPSSSPPPSSRPPSFPSPSPAPSTSPFCSPTSSSPSFPFSYSTSAESPPLVEFLQESVITVDSSQGLRNSAWCAHCKLHAANCILQTAHCSLHTAH